VSEPEHIRRDIEEHRVVEPGRDNFTGYAAIKYAAIVIIVIAVLYFLAMYVLPLFG
jgi:cell division septal protein FtsQ